MLGEPAPGLATASPPPPLPPRRLGGRAPPHRAGCTTPTPPTIYEMTEFSHKDASGNGPQADYDRQFEEDLERARALSLESLALEKFRMQKELESISNSTDSSQKSSSDWMPIRRRPGEKLVLTPRPRPTLVGTRVSQILAPPPSGQRRNSTAAAVPSKPEVELNTNDLISFNSPSPTDKNNQCSILQDLCRSERILAADEQNQVTVRLERSKSSVGCRSSSYYTATYSNHHAYSPPVSYHGLEGYRGGSVDRTIMLGGHSQFGSHQRTSVSQLPTSFVPGTIQTDGSALLNTIGPVVNIASEFQSKQQFDQSSLKTPWSAFDRQISNTSNASMDSNVSLDVLKVMEKRDDNNLIDLPLSDSLNEGDDKNSVRVSVLDLFDPLHADNNCSSRKASTSSGSQSATESENKVGGDPVKGDEGVYDPYDPFDYMYAPSQEGSQSDPVYAAVVRECTTPVDSASPPPLPPRTSAAWSTIERRKSSCERRLKTHKTKSRLYENIQVQKCRAALHDVDLLAFHKMVKDIRQDFLFNDQYTNVGLVISPTIDSYYAEGTSIKLIVHSKNESSPVIFTCDVNSTVEHVILHVVCELEGELTGDAKDYVLKVWGFAEYLTSHTSLSDYEHVHQCSKLEKDVELSILHVDELRRPLARTVQDDNNDGNLTLEDLLPNEPVHPISHDQLMILLETLEREMERVQNAAAQMSDKSDPTLMPSLQSTGVVQSVKLICALLGNIETLEITEAVEAFSSSCLQFIPSAQMGSDDLGGVSVYHPEILGEDGDYSVVTLRKSSSRRSELMSLHETISVYCENIRIAVQNLVETYCHAFRVDFQISSRAELPTSTKSSCEILDPVLVHVGGLHRLLQGWNHEEYIVAAQIYHGTRPVGHPVLTRPMKKSVNFSPRVMFDFWLNFEGTTICMLPRESRIVFVVYGQVIVPPEGDSKDNPAEPQVQKIELGWAAMQFFNCEGVMTQGSCLLSLWPAIADKRLGPAPAPGTCPHGDIDPVLWAEIPEYGCRVVFPPLINPEVSSPKYDFHSLDRHTQDLLENISQSDTFARTPPEDREIFWEKRHYLHAMPNALPKVLLAAHSWDWACLGDLHAMLHGWSEMDPVNALQLLLPCFPDVEVRRVAVSWVQNMGSDELVDYLPQLVQALKHETWEASPLARFLLERSLTSPRVAHHLYWLLMQSLPGQSPQNSSDVTFVDDHGLSEARYHRRLQLMLRALFTISGEALRQRFLSQQLLVKSLYEIAENVKVTKENLRLNVLIQELQSLHHSLEESSTCLPLSPSLEVGGIHVRSCSYFPSNTLPLKINFQSVETGIIPAIFKVGDDLQQDMLTIQMVRIMDKLWLKEGLDLKMVTFSCVPTGHKRGMIEMVTNAETLRKIQVELGLTGSFKDRPIAEWLAKHNPSAFEYERAVKNFTASCAGYSVATYILGICDRHNDNIMLKTSGHLFHIDFGKFLGDAQMFGNFKRDRTPFVLTSDMAYVINGGDKPSAKFHHFVDLCCRAFNIVRKHGNLLLNLFGLMTSSGIPGVTMDAVHYVQKALLPGLSNPEAAAMFARMIENSLKSWFTQFNFFLHNLAQLRFTGDHNDGELLSFIPRTYTLQQEGRIRSVCVYGYQKRYDPEKYYVYILRIERANQPDPTYLFRSYKEFCEFHQKLCILFPLAKYHSLPTGISMGRSNIKQVAEKRKLEIERFLKSLFMMADEISHSDIVYTFFHPLLRDQQEANIHAKKVKEPKVRRDSAGDSWKVHGQLKLSLHYQRQPGVLMVMVHHARGLPIVAGGQEPSPYVKVYLKPDPTKITKRKTKVVRRNCHPTFMETLEYRLPLEVVRNRLLEATVWNHDTLQENEFLGGFVLPLGSVDLSSDTDEWYSLGNVPRS